MSSDIDRIDVSVIWRVLKGEDPRARRRAVHETLFVLVISLLPLVLGGFGSYVHDQYVHVNIDRGVSYYFVSAMFSGQLFLIFISLAATILARVLDGEGPRYTIQGIVSLFHIVGLCIAILLIAISPNESSFQFWPVGFLSIVFFVVALAHYLFFAIGSHLSSPNLQQSAEDRSAALAKSLEDRMKPDAAA